MLGTFTWPCVAVVGRNFESSTRTHGHKVCLCVAWNAGIFETVAFMVAQSVSQNAPIGISTSHHGLSQGGRCLCPDYKLETGSESCSSKHNPLVPGSSPGGPTNSETPVSDSRGFFFLG